MKKIKFKLRSIWKSSELKVLSMLLFILIPLIMSLCIEDLEKKSATSTPMIIVGVSYSLAILIGFKSIYKDYKRNIKEL